MTLKNNGHNLKKLKYGPIAAYRHGTFTKAPLINHRVE